MSGQENQGADGAPAPTTLAAQNSETARPPRRLLRKFLRGFLLVVVPLAALGVGLLIYMSTGRYVETDNAYVKARLHIISPQVDGRVKRVLTAENQQVTKGQLLVELEPEAFQITLAAARAELEVVRRSLQIRQADYRQAEIEIELAREAIRFHAMQYQRNRHLRGRGIASATRLDESEHQLRNARQRLRASEERRKSILAELGGKMSGVLTSHPRVHQIQAKIDAALLNLKRTRILAPTDGIMAKIKAEPGEVVAANKPIGLLVDDKSIWIEANLKETQLTHVRVGQSASFTVDAYPGMTLRATVSSIAPATGAEFALLPAQNASGNWVKVVQRLPVRLTLKGLAPPRGGQGLILRAGMTVSLAIDTKQVRKMPAIISQVLAYARNLP